ncbi:MAG TPA: RdgB/HAM1 family non-canonical purine NTP pyrophosphatase [Terriglobales bacterium]|nr:RdgB/HAM1 family non-canonical purine NTP pyrophosphatase [Terriglobales bacterium]
MVDMEQIYIASSNPGKLRDFSAAGRAHQVEIVPVPDFEDISAVAENADSFEGNARAKAEHYSRYCCGHLIVADDSGLEVDALNGAPGIYSARYASGPHHQSTDAENNARLIYELKDVPEGKRTARFVCALAVARNGETVETFSGEARGRILLGPRGSGGFGYDPLFLHPELQKTFAELTAEEKMEVSHRGQAFRYFLDWLRTQK